MLSPDDILAHAVNIYVQQQHNMKYVQNMDDSAISWLSFPRAAGKL